MVQHNLIHSCGDRVTLCLISVISPLPLFCFLDRAPLSHKDKRHKEGKKKFGATNRICLQVNSMILGFWNG